VLFAPPQLREFFGASRFERLLVSGPSLFLSPTGCGLRQLIRRVVSDVCGPGGGEAGAVGVDVVDGVRRCFGRFGGMSLRRHGQTAAKAL
jgi:hypothetical protein